MPAVVQALLADAPETSPVSDELDEAFGDDRGSLLRRGVSVWEALPPGADDTILTVDGVDPTWRTLSALLDAIFGTDAGTMMYRDASGVWLPIDPTAAGDDYVLTWDDYLEVPYWATPTGGGGGAGTSKVTKSAVSLGTQSALQSAYTYYTVASVCARGMMSRILITASVAGSFDVVVRGAASDSGTLWLQAYSVGGLTYEVTFPTYVENDAAGQDFFIGIRNGSQVSQTYTLTALRVEKFA